MEGGHSHQQSLPDKTRPAPDQNPVLLSTQDQNSVPLSTQDQNSVPLSTQDQEIVSPSAEHDGSTHPSPNMEVLLPSASRCAPQDEYPKSSLSSDRKASEASRDVSRHLEGPPGSFRGSSLPDSSSACGQSGSGDVSSIQAVADTPEDVPPSQSKEPSWSLPHSPLKPLPSEFPPPTAGDEGDTASDSSSVGSGEACARPDCLGEDVALSNKPPSQTFETEALKMPEKPMDFLRMLWNQLSQPDTREEKRNGKANAIVVGVPRCRESLNRCLRLVGTQRIDYYPAKCQPFRIIENPKEEGNLVHLFQQSCEATDKDSCQCGQYSQHGSPSASNTHHNQVRYCVVGVPEGRAEIRSCSDTLKYPNTRVVLSSSECSFRIMKVSKVSPSSKGQKTAEHSKPAATGESRFNIKLTPCEPPKQQYIHFPRSKKGKGLAPQNRPNDEAVNRVNMPLPAPDPAPPQELASAPLPTQTPEAVPEASKKKVVFNLADLSARLQMMNAAPPKVFPNSALSQSLSPASSASSPHRPALMLPPSDPESPSFTPSLPSATRSSVLPSLPSAPCVTMFCPSRPCDLQSSSSSLQPVFPTLAPSSPPPAHSRHRQIFHSRDLLDPQSVSLGCQSSSSSSANPHSSSSSSSRSSSDSQFKASPPRAPESSVFDCPSTSQQCPLPSSSPEPSHLLSTLISYVPSSVLSSCPQTPSTTSQQGITAPITPQSEQVSVSVKHNALKHESPSETKTCTHQKPKGPGCVNSDAATRNKERGDPPGHAQGVRPVFNRKNFPQHQNTKSEVQTSKVCVGAGSPLSSAETASDAEVSQAYEHSGYDASLHDTPTDCSSSLDNSNLTSKSSGEVKSTDSIRQTRRRRASVGAIDRQNSLERSTSQSRSDTSPRQARENSVLENIPGIQFINRKPLHVLLVLFFILIVFSLGIRFFFPAHR